MKTQVIVFDWGDTLMKVFPQYSGAMMDWPVVEAVAGAREALQKLSGQYRLIVGTNAANSTADQIKTALQKVNLAEPIETVFTYSELGARKPDKNFFWQLEAQLGCSRDQLVMVGDDFRVDIIGAARAGWRSIWLNPRQEIATGLWPIQSAEIRTMHELPGILQQVNYPSPEESITWLQEEGTSNTLLMHVQMVAALAYILAVHLRRVGVRVNPVLAHRGGLLHDLAKLSARNVQAEKDHGQVAAERLSKYQQPELAEIALRHLLFCLLDPERSPRTWEEKLVYFADKLVEGGSLASIETRLSALKSRYSSEEDRISEMKPMLLNMQAEIAQQLNWNENDFIERLQSELWVK